MGAEQSMTTASRIDNVVERLREEAEAFGGSKFPDDDGNVLAALFTEAADLLLHLKPVLEENERYREALRDIANAIRCGAETDVMAWARLAEAQKGVARAALSQKGER